MSEELKYIELITWNRKMILLHGDKLTPIQKAIGLRSNGLHSEIRFSDRYGRISFSCTLADGVGGCRFKMIDYSHPYRQSRVRIPVTAEREARLFIKACQMADRRPSDMPLEISLMQLSTVEADFCSYGLRNIKYDEWGARLSFISRKLNWWKMHPEWMICNEAVANVFLEEWPNMIAPHYPHKLTPDELEYLVRHYVEKELS